MLKIEVKNKQGHGWPNCKGINQKDSFIVFVDFKDLRETERSDLYILSEKDWSNLVIKKQEEYRLKHPEARTIIENNVLIYIDQINKQGIQYKGCGINPRDIESFKEC